MPLDVITEALARAVPVAVFLLAITAMADLADLAGVFDTAGARVAAWGRGRTWLLWILFALLSVTCTAFLSLDTTAVLLTPVALVVARRAGVAARPFALTTLWVANTGSLFLPVSNLTNLLARDRFARLGVDHAGYVRLAFGPAVAAVTAALVLVAVLHRRDLAGRYAAAPERDTDDRPLLVTASAVCLAVGPAFAVGVEPWLVAVVALTLLAVATAVRAPARLREVSPPWLMAAAFTVLTVAVALADHAGWLTPLARAAGAGTGTGDLLRLAAVSALGANLVDNLPAYLAVEPAGTTPARLMAVLVGVGAGPLVTPWGSLATLLWLQRCSAAGVRWHLPRLALLGLACATASVTAGVLALSVTP